MTRRLETIAERRERLLEAHARANAARMRVEYWNHKRESGAHPIPLIQTEEK